MTELWQYFDINYEIKVLQIIASWTNVSLTYQVSLNNDVSWHKMRDKYIAQLCANLKQKHLYLIMYQNLLGERIVNSLFFNSNEKVLMKYNWRRKEIY